MNLTRVSFIVFAVLAAACSNDPTEADLGSGYDPAAGSKPPGAHDGGVADSGSSNTSNGPTHDSGAPPVSNGGCDAGDPSCGAPALDAATPWGEAGAGEAGACANGQAGLLGAIPGATMAPGTACIACHVSTNAKSLGIAGTVYGLPHEADNCIGVAQNIKVVITDSAGQTHDLAVNSSGNFTDTSILGISAPYTAAVVGPGGSRPMIASITNGDCNSCHTAAGASNAPGRIMAP